MNQNRHQLRQLDDEELGISSVNQEANALVQRLRNAIFLTRLVRRSLLPAILTGILLIAWLTFELLAPRNGKDTMHPAALLLAGANLDVLLADQPWRLVAALLLHAGAAHFAVNATGTWFLSQMADNVLGSARTIVIFVAGGALSFAASAALSSTPSVGASGGVYALLGALITTAISRRRLLPEAPWRWLAGFAGLWIVMSVVFAITSRTTDTAAHAGGFLSGAFLSLAMGRRIPLFEPEPLPTPRPVLVLASLCLIAMAVSFAMSVRGMTMRADLTDPGLVQTSLPGLSLPLPSRWSFGRLRDHKCVSEPVVPTEELAMEGPLCATDPYGSILVLGRAVDVVPGVVLDSSMTAEYGLRSFIGESEGEVTRRWLVLDRRWTLAFNCYTLLATKYEGMLSLILGGMRLDPDGATYGRPTPR